MSTAYKCDSCGAGWDGKGTATLPRGFPFSTECAECKQRNVQRMKELGRRRGQQYEDAILKSVFGDVEDRTDS